MLCALRKSHYSCSPKGRAIAQTVSRWLPTTAAWVRARVWSCGICGGQSGAGAGFLRVLRFPPSIFIPPIAPQSPSSIIWSLYNRPEVAAVPSGLSLTPLIIKKIALLVFSNFLIFKCLWFKERRSQWPRSLRHELSSLAETLGLWAGMSVFVLSCV
jgi:hypothetical protein